SFAVGATEGEPRCKLITEWAGDGSPGLHISVVAITEFKDTTGRKTRFARRNIERAGSSVLTEKSSLGTTEYLDPFHVEKVQGGGGGSGIINAIDIKTHAGIDTIVGQTERRARTPDVQRSVSRIRGIELY